jgi:acetyltransferase-like isoleucine patch superfamily enzyme
MLKTFANFAAKQFKGPQYRIDPCVPLGALMNYGLRRVAGLMRCVFKRAKISLRLKGLIFLGPSVELRNKRFITFGCGVTLGRGVIIDGLSREGVRIGDRVSIGQYTIIEATGVISEIGNGVSIGADSGLGAYSFVGAAGGVRVGKNVIIGQRVSFHSENHNFERTDIPIKEQGVTRRGIAIDDDCWIGANVVLLDGSRVGKGCVIAAGAVVTGEIPPYSVAAGVPAKILRSRKNCDVL